MESREQIRESLRYLILHKLTANRAQKNSTTIQGEGGKDDNQPVGSNPFWEG